ncbi:MAG TPA: 50S ribosomal protein L6 [Phycisphaerales bacterium]|nr:50S ribosomal protein L6 [Phycisphaerales bacterium]
MSRIGKKAVPVPAGVKVAVKDQAVHVEGPKGKLTLATRPEVKVSFNESDKAVSVALAEGFTPENKEANAYWGSTRAHIRNMVEGVTKGYEKNLEVVGVGWQATMAGKQVKLVVGYANPIMVDIPQGVTVAIDKQFVKITGPDKGVVGHFAASMRAVRKPEPYNGKGIKYTDEVVKRKQGKQFGA